MKGHGNKGRIRIHKAQSEELINNVVLVRSVRSVSSRGKSVSKPV